MSNPDNQPFGQPEFTRMPDWSISYWPMPDPTTFDGRVDAAIDARIARQQANTDYAGHQREERQKAERLRASVLAAQKERNRTHQGVDPVEVWGTEGAETCKAFLARMHRKGISGERLSFPPEKRSFILPFLKRRETPEKMEAFNVAFTNLTKVRQPDPSHFKFGIVGPQQETVRYSVYLCSDGLLRIKGDSGCLEYPPVTENGERTRIYCEYSYTAMERNPNYNPESRSPYKEDSEIIEVTHFQEQSIGETLERLAVSLESSRGGFYPYG